MLLTKLIKKIKDKFTKEDDGLEYLVVKPLSLRDFEQECLSYSLYDALTQKNTKKETIEKYSKEIDFAIRLYNKELRKKVTFENSDEKEEFMKNLYDKFNKEVQDKNFLRYKKTLQDILGAHDSNFHNDLFFYDKFGLEKKIEIISEVYKNKFKEEYLLTSSEKLNLKLNNSKDIHYKKKQRENLLQSIANMNITTIRENILKDKHLAWVQNYDQFKQLFQDYDTITNKDTFEELKSYITSKKKIALSYDKVNEYLGAYFNSDKNLEKATQFLKVSKTYVSNLGRKYLEFKKRQDNDLENINNRTQANKSYLKDLNKLTVEDYNSFIDYLKKKPRKKNIERKIA